MPDISQQTGFQAQNFPMKLRMWQGGLTNVAFAGLNTTGGPIHLVDNESSDLQNVDFNKFGSILKRGGYVPLNTTPISGSPSCDGLYWYEYTSGNSIVRNVINISGANAYYMSNLDGTWNNISPAGITIATGDPFDFDTFMNNVYMVNGYNIPMYWNGSGHILAIPSLTSNCYTFQVLGITTVPTVGSHYTNNGVTFTITAVNLGGPSGSIGGQIVATGSSAPIAGANTLTKSSGTGDTTISYTTWVLNANIQNAKYVAQFNNYLFLGNVEVDGISYKTRVYWCNIEDPLSWSGLNWTEVSMNDGQEITALAVLGPYLVVYKSRSIYVISFTGNSTIPFVVTKSNSDIGCIAPFSIQETQNTHVFLGPDGIYGFDGNNSQKLSYQLDYTFLNSLNRDLLSNARSLIYKTKNRYLLAVPSSGSSENDTIIVYDYYMVGTLGVNGWSIYKGIAASSMYTFYIDGWDNKPYFSDYSGFTYEMDVGLNDYPLNVKTSISAYYCTNWKSFDDLVHQKFSLSAYIYYNIFSAKLNFSYSYDFETADQYTKLIDMSGGGTTWANFIWGQGTWAKSGGRSDRIDINGRGRAVRFKFSNSNIDETFSIDGFSTLSTGDTFE